MTASVVEQVLARVHAVLQTLPGLAGVARSRLPALEEDELPFASLRRESSAVSPESEQISRHLVNFEIDIFSSGASWETSADALHCAIDAALSTDVPLAAIGHWLTCTGTDVQSADTEITAGRLTARYEITCFTASGAPGTAL